MDFADVRERVVAQTQTERGRAYTSKLSPLTDFDTALIEQQRTASVRQLMAEHDLFIARAIETEAFTAAAARGSSLGASDLREVADALASAAAAYNKLREAEGDAREILGPVTANYAPLKGLIDGIRDAIDERGVVQDRASPALARIRRSLQHAQNDARDRVSAMVRSQKYANAIQDAVVTIREGRFVVPIKAEFAGEFPGIVHDTSSSGQTLFIEPLAALETNNRLRTLRLDEEREVTRVLAALSRDVGEHAAQIEANVEMLATLDVLAAKARVAVAMDANPPELVREPRIVIHNGRHPLLGQRAIAQSLSINPSQRIIVISGPNMGGKTVALKMVGLFVAMTYCGMQIPAQPGSVIGCFERIFTDIGDEQSIVENASTFSAHIKRMREIIEAADERSLVLVDEIGGGTEPAAGAALAIAMLERLLSVRSCAIVTTHSTELKLFAHGTDGIQNASVRFNPNTFAPTYQLDVGTPGQSLAFPLSRALGIPKEILERAEALLSSRERDYEHALADLSKTQAELAAARDRAQRETAHLQKLQDQARKRNEALEKERKEFGAKADERMREALTEFVAELGRRAQAGARPKVTQSQSALLSSVLEELHRDLGVSATMEEGKPSKARPFETGSIVHVNSFGADGTVLADNGDRLLVAIGAMQTTVPKSDVRSAPARKKGTGGAGDAALRVASSANVELDVRGKRFVEAQPEVERWIDEATLTGSSPLRLIHGKGTGLLGRGLQEYLRSHPAVKNVRYGDANEGGSGVTVFELR